MIVKFKEEAGSHALEVEKNEKGVRFYVYDEHEEQIGCSAVIPSSEIDNIINYLQSIR